MDRRFGSPGSGPSGGAGIVPFGGSRVPQLQDAFGRVVQIGDEVIAPGMEIRAPRFIVVDVRPALDPKAPAGAVRVVLQHTLSAMTPGDQPVAEFIRVREKAEFTPLVGPDGEAALPPSGVTP
jgi:hypothetical protein